MERSMLKDLLESIDNDSSRLQELVFAFNDLESGTIVEELDELDVGFQVIVEMAKHLNDEQINLFCEALESHTLVEDEVMDELLDEHDYLEEAEDIEEDEIDEDDLNEIERFKVKRRTAKVKRVLAQRGRAKEKLKGKADTEVFKRKFQYDKSKKRFIRRKKEISRGQFKKHNREFKKLMKRRQKR